ncbi:MAG: response regulator transcription factor [Bacillaceae bacterium]|nr:response regulator transcription factor [Bacillaceae bacterium]
MRTMIVDDEMLSRDELRYLIDLHDDFEVCGEASTAVDAMKKYLEIKPDVVFLDIQMQDMDGMMVARQWQEQKNPPLIVFATAYDEHAVDAFAVNAVDYLLKPFDKNRIEDTIKRIRQILNNGRNGAESNVSTVTPLSKKVNKLIVEDKDRTVLINPEDIVYAFREDRRVYLKTNDHVYSTLFSLQTLEDKLREYPFFRTHRSYLVNLNMIAEMIPWFNGAYNLRMKDEEGSTVPVSRNYVRELMEKLEL